MRIRSTLIAGSLMLLLTACGGSSLSFKNSDEVIKSYRSVTAKLTEAERQEFRRNMFLVAWTAETPEAKVSVSDVLNAWSHERNTLDLTGPDAAPLAKELALRGVSKLDGKSVSQVNELGEALTSIAVDSQIKSIEEKIGTLDAAIKQLTADKDSWRARKKEAAAAEDALVADTKKYKPKILSKEIAKNWQGLALTGNISMSSPYEDPINDFRNAFTIEHNGHSVRYRSVLGQFTNFKKQSFFNLNVNTRDFVNAQGDKLPEDYVLPNDISAYDVKFRPVRVRTSGKKDGWKTHEYELSAELTQALYNLPTALKKCDQGIETAQKLRAAYETQIETLRARKFDDLKNIYGSYAEGCI